MTSLVGYASSDEGETEAADAGPTTVGPATEEIGDHILERTANSRLARSAQYGKTPSQPGLQHPSPDPRLDGESPKHALGRGPMGLSPEGDGEVESNDAAPTGVSSPPPPSSPYTTTRELLRNLSLPSVPNLDVPPSPLGTPPPGHAALTAKFENFLELKRTKGTHFNARLAQSAAMRNPALMDKLLGFVGLEEPAAAMEEDDRDAGPKRGAGVAGQYSTVLSSDLWDPNAFPDWAFRGELRKTHEKMQLELETERASGRRNAIEFVPASGTSAPAAGQRKTRFDKDEQR